MIVGRVNRFDIIESRQALPLDGNIGGLNKHIINPEKVKLFDFSILKP